ncbi:MAG TPA: carbohydrate ABC transporter permease [Isosphaeraceae bacterium]|nr:carbohydrate ABC transporter permease [Isosphaeraceae bacterium]
MAELTRAAPAVAEVRPRPLRLDRLAGRIALYAVLIILSFSFLLPLLWMISTSLKDTPQTYHVPPIWIPWPMRFQNYPEALMAQPFGLFFLNTLRYAVFSALGAVLSSALVAYGFSRIRWRGRDVLFFLSLCTMMIPFEVRMIPLYLIFRNLHWLNSYKPLIVPAFFGSAYFIFLLRQFFMSIPLELSEAARIDGAGELSIFLRIILPLAKPAIAVVGLFQCIDAWNDFLGPLIYLNQPELFPVSLGLQRFLGQFVEKLAWPYLMAASTVVITPVVVVFFFAQRTFIEGIAISGIKG